MPAPTTPHQTRELMHLVRADIADTAALSIPLGIRMVLILFLFEQHPHPPLTAPLYLDPPHRKRLKASPSLLGAARRTGNEGRLALAV